MKCPRCRREMAFDATSHQCGWRVTGGQVSGKDDEAPRASAEVAEAHLQKIRATLALPPRKEVAGAAEVEVKKRVEVPMMKDVGHGNSCTCALCWAARMEKTFGEVEVVKAAPPDTAPVVETTTKLEELQRLFPLEGHDG